MYKPSPEGSSPTLHLAACNRSFQQHNCFCRHIWRPSRRLAQSRYSVCWTRARHRCPLSRRSGEAHRCGRWDSSGFRHYNTPPGSNNSKSVTALFANPPTFTYNVSSRNVPRLHLVGGSSPICGSCPWSSRLCLWGSWSGRHTCSWPSDLDWKEPGWVPSAGLVPSVARAGSGLRACHKSA